MTQTMSRTFQGKRDTYVSEGAVLGTGQTAAVFKVRAQETSGPDYALKLLTDEALKQRFLEELTNLRLMEREREWLRTEDGDPLVPQVIDHQDSPDNTFIVMTLADGTPIDELLRAEGQLDEPEALTILIQVISTFHVLHTRLHRSYLDWQPRNVFWNRERQWALVLDWNLLSKEGAADVPADILALGTMLYRMVVGVQPPVTGLSAAPAWHNLTPGMQQILRKATHPDPHKRYVDVLALQEACESQLKLWRGDAPVLVTELTKKKEEFEAIKSSSSHLVTDQHLALTQLARSVQNLAAVLDARGDELGHYTAVFERVKQDLTPYWRQYASLISRGVYLLVDGGDVSGARETFDRALAEDVDDAEKLTAMRWLQVTNTGSDRARSAARAACEALLDQRHDAALQALQGLNSSTESAAANLLADAQAQIQWLEYCRLQARAENAANEDEALSTTTKALEKLSELQSSVQFLPSVYRQLLQHTWGDLTQHIQDLQVKLTERQKADQRFEALKHSLNRQSAHQALETLIVNFAEAPRHPTLSAIALEEGQNRLSQVMNRNTEVGNLAPQVLPIREILGLGLAHSQRAAIAQALRAEWNTAQALIELDHALAVKNLTAQELAGYLDQIAQANSALLKDEALTAAASHVINAANQRLDAALAQNMLRAATNRLSSSNMESLRIEYQTILNTIDQEQSEQKAQQEHTRTSLVERINRLVAAQNMAAIKKAREDLKLGDRLLDHDQVWRERRYELAQQIAQEESRLQQLGEEGQEKEALNERLQYELGLFSQAATIEDVQRIEKELVNLHSLAARVDVVRVSEIDEWIEKVRRRINDINSVEQPLASAAALFYKYGQLASNDADLRAARFVKLRKAREKLQAIDEKISTPALDHLRHDVELAWQSEGFEDHPANPQNPLKDVIGQLGGALVTLKQQVTMVENRVDESAQKTLTDNRVVRRTGWILAVGLLVLLLGGMYFLLNFFNPSDQIAAVSPAIERSLAPMQAGLEGVQQGISELANRPTADLAPLQEGIANLSEQLAGVNAAVLAAATPGAPSLEQIEAARLTAEADLQPTLAAVASREAAVQQREAQAASTAQRTLLEQATVEAQATAQAARSTELEGTTVALATREAQAAVTAQRTLLEQATVEAQATAQAAQLEGTAVALETRAAELNTTAEAIAAGDQPDPQAADIQATIEAQTAREIELNTTATALATREAAVAARESEQAMSLIEPGQIAFSFPPADAQYYVAPWRVDITATVWLTPENDAPAVNYRLTLNNVDLGGVSAVLAEFNRSIGTSDIYTYERGFVLQGGVPVLFDGFPTLSEDNTALLQLDENNQLRPGTYRLGLDYQSVDGSWRTLPVTRTFTILDRGMQPPVTATIGNASGPFQRRSGPSREYASDRADEITLTDVVLLGRVFGRYWNPPETEAQARDEYWYLVELSDNPPRHGWVPERFITNPSADLNTVAEIGPPQNQQ